MKKIAIALLIVVLISVLVATAASAAGPVGCNGPIHGAFNAHNLVYGVQSSPGNGDSLNSSSFGLSGGSGGGQTGINNRTASEFCNGN